MAQRPKDYTQIEVTADAPDFWEQRSENDGSGNSLYTGYSYTPNASTSASVWYIFKNTYDVNNGLTRRQLPDSGPKFAYAWDDRASIFT